jgi:hypothetical protein
MRSTATNKGTNMMRACCESGYCQSEAAAMAADEAFGEGWEILAVDPEARPFVTADDLPLDAEEADYADEGEAFAHYISGERW